MNRPLVTKARRSELHDIRFSGCSTCKETIIWGLINATQKMVPFEPKPTHGTEIDPGYSRHFCASTTDE